MLTGKAAVLTPAPFWTVIDAAPGAAISVAGTVARSTELDTWLVVRAVPFQSITAFGANDSPNAVNVKSLPPLVMTLGNTEFRVNGGTGATVKFTAFEMGALGFE